jgi:hypothetical protein
MPPSGAQKAAAWAADVARPKPDGRAIPRPLQNRGRGDGIMRRHLRQGFGQNLKISSIPHSPQELSATRARTRSDNFSASSPSIWARKIQPMSRCATPISPICAAWVIKPSAMAKPVA